MFEKAERELHAQHIPHSLIDICHPDLPGLHEVRQVIMVKTADHVHVDASQNARRAAVAPSFAIPCGNQFRYRGPVAVDNALKAPLLAKNLFRVAFAEVGMPFSALKALMIDAVPAFTAERNGGR
jgi:hypothetical protein